MEDIQKQQNNIQTQQNVQEQEIDLLELAKKLWAEKKLDFTALFVLSDSTAFSVYQACYECGITIPDQLSVVVAGEAWNLAYRAPALTSVGIDHVRLIEEAVRLLKNPDPEKFEHVQLKAELTVRESTCRVDL